MNGNYEPGVLQMQTKLLLVMMTLCFCTANLHAEPKLFVANQGPSHVVGPDCLYSGGDRARDFTFGRDGNLYMSSFGTGQILRFDGRTCDFIDVFIEGSTSPSRLGEPEGLAFGPDGNLYVVDEASSSPLPSRVLRFNGQTGAFMNTFATGGGLDTGKGMEFGPDGNLYVASFSSGQIIKYNGASGDPIDAIPTGFINGPRDIAFGPDGDMFVSDQARGEVIRFDGATHAFEGVFTSNSPLDLDVPYGLEFGPDGDLYVARHQFGVGGVLQYDGETGVLVGGGIASPDTPTPTYLHFTTIPEPRSIILVGFAAVAAFVLRQRRKRVPR